MYLMAITAYSSNEERMSRHGNKVTNRVCNSFNSDYLCSHIYAIVEGVVMERRFGKKSAVEGRLDGGGSGRSYRRETRLV